MKENELLVAVAENQFDYEKKLSLVAFFAFLAN